MEQTLHRRHLDESQRAKVAAKLANLGDGQRADHAAQICAPVTQDRAAEMLNVGTRTVAVWLAELTGGDEDTAIAVTQSDVVAACAPN